MDRYNKKGEDKDAVSYFYAAFEFEVFGLSDADFKKLEIYYHYLELQGGEING